MKEKITTINPVKQIWYANDAAGGGKIGYNILSERRKDLCANGPLFGYHPNPSKTWVIKEKIINETKTNFICIAINTYNVKYKI